MRKWELGIYEKQKFGIVSAMPLFVISKEARWNFAKKIISPAVCSATNFDTLATRCHKYMTLIRHPAAAEFFTSPFCNHDTDAVLSLNISTCLQQRFLVPEFPSNTIHTRSFPAIYRSFISKSPPGFLGVISLAHNLFGHYKRQIFGSSAFFTVSQPHPTTCLDASTQPRNYGSPLNNYFYVIGSHSAYFRSIIQY